MKHYDHVSMFLPEPGDLQDGGHY